MNENNENFANAMPYQQQQAYLPPYGNTVPQYVAKPKPTFTKNEKILSVLVAILSFLFVHFVLWNTRGFFTSAFYIAALTVSLTYLTKCEYKFSTSHKVWSVIMYCFSTVFSLTDNNFIKQLDSIFLHIGIAYLIYSVTSKRQLFGRYSVFEIVKCNLGDPFSHFGAEYSAINSTVKSTKTGTNLKAVIGGLILALPLTLVVAALLMSADKGVASMLHSLALAVNMDNVFSLIAQIAVSIPVAGYLFGLIYSHTHPEITKPLIEENCDQTTFKFRIVSNIALYSSITPICILYILFFVSQANYFLSAFSGDLPKQFSYAEYARRGFFELFAIELINAGVIFFINFFAKNTGKNKPAPLKFYTVTVSVFTLLITATAVSKMVLYIQNYGLTQLRVYTTWFMLLTALIFVFVIIKQFKIDFQIIRTFAVVFTIFFAALCFSRPDALIARYNMENCMDSLSYNDIYDMVSLSADAAAVVLEPEYRTDINEKYEIKNKAFNNAPGSDAGYEELCRFSNAVLNHSDYNKYNYSSLKLISMLDS